MISPGKPKEKPPGQGIPRPHRDVEPRKKGPATVFVPKVKICTTDLRERNFGEFEHAYEAGVVAAAYRKCTTGVRDASFRDGLKGAWDKHDKIREEKGIWCKLEPVFCFLGHPFVCLVGLDIYEKVSGQSSHEANGLKRPADR